MSKTKQPVISALCCLFLFPLGVSAQELRFRGPGGVPNISRPVTVHAGDVDGDGKLDLISSNGSRIVTVSFQDPQNRNSWTNVLVRVGASCFFTRAGDFDGDGFDDLAVADGGSTTYYIRSRGDRTFDNPVPLREARGSRWIALGDWNKDGHLDLASSNLATSTLTMFIGDGAGNFTVTGQATSGREHTLETLDYDGDGNLDLALGTGLPGIQLHQGQGDGTFRRRSQVPGHLGILGCVEYIAVGDFNNDGLDDLAPTCIDDQTAYAGISMGDGKYERILKDPFAGGTESSAVGDLNGDGNDDLALVSHGSLLVRVYVGNGDGTFEEKREFGSTGKKPVFLIAEDIDRDGYVDVISANEASSNLTIFFGREGEQFLESSQNISGYGSARGYAITDFDQDRFPDFFFASAIRPEVSVFLNPGVSEANVPNFTIDVAARYALLEVVDLNDDGIVDLVGGDNSSDSILTALVDAEGNARDEQSMPCLGNPRAVRTGFLDDGPTVDIAAFCSSADELLVFLGNGDGTFETAAAVPTIVDVRELAVGDTDGDGRDDLVAVGSDEIAIHFGLDGGGFAPAAFVVQDENRRMTHLALADVDGDGLVDVLAADAGKLVLFLRNKGAREFAEPVIVEVLAAPASLGTADVDDDGRLDIFVGLAREQTVQFILNLGPDGFSDALSQRAGVTVEAVGVLDVNGDRVNDIVAFARSSTAISLGISDEPPPPPRFLRGDADNDGKVALNDAVAILNHLFRAAGPLACPDAGDSDDDGKVALTDAVEILSYLFRGGRAPAAPGAEKCGEDTGVDELGDCSEHC